MATVKRNVLVSVLGETPAILTEVFYYFAHSRRPPIMFDEVRAFTTRPGKEAAVSQLLCDRPGQNQFYLLLKHLKIDRSRISFDQNHIRVFKDSNHKELNDIRTEEDSLYVADQLFKELRELCSDGDTAVYASIAGGRKTMGVSLASVMQLFGRPQDRLLHVLIHPKIEEAMKKQKVAFYFPDSGMQLKLGSLRPEEMIQCSEIPLLHWPWKEDDPREAATYSEFQQRRQRDIQWSYDPPWVTIDARTRSVEIDGDKNQRVELGNIPFFYYYFFAELAPNSLSLRDFAAFWDRAREKYPEVPADLRKNENYALLLRLKELFDFICPSDRGRETPFPHRLDQDFASNNKYLLEQISKIKKSFSNVIGPVGAEFCSIRNRGGEKKATYGLGIDATKIHISNPIPRASEITWGSVKERI